MSGAISGSTAIAAISAAATIGSTIYTMTQSRGGGGSAAPQQPTLAPTRVPAAPSRTARETQEAAEEQRRKFGAGGGRTETNLTGGLGVPSSAGSYAASNLLGGSA